jgi:uncharacterized membrane protein (UPF0127 family)
MGAHAVKIGGQWVAVDPVFYDDGGWAHANPSSDAADPNARRAGPLRLDDTGSVCAARGALLMSGGPLSAHLDPQSAPTPVSLAFLDGGAGKVLAVQDAGPGACAPPIGAPKSCQFVLVMPRGWFEERHVSAGDHVEYSELLNVAVECSPF